MRIAMVEPAPTLTQLTNTALTHAGHLVEELAVSPENISAVRQACQASDAVAYLPTGWCHDAAVHEQRWIDTLISALEGTGKHLLYLSDASVIGPTSDHHPGSEDSGTSSAAPHPWRVRNEEHLAVAHSEGVRSIVVRPALIYGHRAGRLVDDVCRYAENTGQAFYVADGSARTSTIHADDLVDLLVAAIERAPGGFRYFAASDEVVTWRQVAETVARETGGDCAPTSLPPEAADVAGLDVSVMTIDSVIEDAAPSRRLSWRASRPPLLAGNL